MRTIEEAIQATVPWAGAASGSGGAKHRKVACPRCGVRRSRPSDIKSAGICRDCRDVTVLLGELEVWT